MIPNGVVRMPFDAYHVVWSNGCRHTSPLHDQDRPATSPVSSRRKKRGQTDVIRIGRSPRVEPLLAGTPAPLLDERQRPVSVPATRGRASRRMTGVGAQRKPTSSRGSGPISPLLAVCPAIPFWWTQPRTWCESATYCDRSRRPPVSRTMADWRPYSRGRWGPGARSFGRPGEQSTQQRG
jgi:hypothetical protein